MWRFSYPFFLPAWIPCNSSCSEAPGFTFYHADQWSSPWLGSLTSYYEAGYQLLLSQERRAAVREVDRLRSGGWLDALTRGLLLEVSVFNPNTRLFTQVRKPFSLILANYTHFILSS